MSKPSVLLIAEAANPEWVSVPLVGWSFAAALREVADVHLVTQVRNRDAILRQGWVEGRDFTAIDTEALTRPLWRMVQILRGGSDRSWALNTALGSLSYPYFERLLWQRFGKDITAGRYDVVHRVTPLSLPVVSPVARKCAASGVPFILGPLNGGVPWPAGYEAEREREGESLSRFRSLYRLQPGRLPMYRAAAAILAGSRATIAEIPPTAGDRMIYLPENAIDPARFSKRSLQGVSGPLRACFVGRMVPCKVPHLLIEAIAPFLREGRLKLDMIGDGPLRAELEAQAGREGVSQAVTFHGRVAHERVQDIMVGSNLLTFPSIRDFGGGVVLEAMALGLVPVVVNYGGPAELVTDETGYRVPISPRETMTAAYRERIGSLLDDPSGLPEMGAKARERVFDFFTWPAKARQVAEIYDWALGQRAAPPKPVPLDPVCTVSDEGRPSE